MRTLREYAFATPADLGGAPAYRKVCRVAGLRPIPDGYGFLLAVDKDGKRHTLATADVEYVRAIAEAEATNPDILAKLEIPPNKFTSRPGWPDDWV